VEPASGSHRSHLSFSPNSAGWIDSIQPVQVARATLPDHRGFLKTKVVQVSAAMTPDGAQQIADVFLQTHMRTPLKGTLTIEPGGARYVKGDGHVHPSKLLTMVGELVQLDHRIDPDTGAQGRTGVIAAVSYDADSETATVTLDSSRDNFEAVLARYGAVTGG
jgi:hypothetical protein